jgi:hypothetical protein
MAMMFINRGDHPDDILVVITAVWEDVAFLP